MTTVSLTTTQLPLLIHPTTRRRQQQQQQQQQQQRCPHCRPSDWSFALFGRGDDRVAALVDEMNMVNMAARRMSVAPLNRAAAAAAASSMQARSSWRSGSMFWARPPLHDGT